MEDINGKRLTAGNVMSLFDSIKNIQNEQGDGISDEDRTFCEEQQRLRDEAFDYCLKLSEIKSPEKSDYTTHFGADSIFKAANLANETFIRKVVWHFAETYHVTLESSPIVRSLVYPMESDDYSVDGERGRWYSKIYDHTFSEKFSYSRIVALVTEQLDGKTFRQKAVYEIKTAMKDAVNYRYDHTCQARIKGKVLTISDWVFPEARWNSGYQIRYGYENKLNALYHALYLFSTDSTQYEAWMLHACPIAKGYCSDTVEIGRMYDTNFKQVEGIKFFKNGRVDVKFTSNKDAETFFNEYCRR